MKRRRRADKEPAAPSPPEGGPDEAGGWHAACRAWAGELEARLAAAEAAASELRDRLSAAEAALSEQGGRLATAATTEGELRASLAASEAASAEKGGRLAEAEAALSEQRGRLAAADDAELRATSEALAGEHAAEAREHAAVLASSREQAALAALGPGASSFGAVEAALRAARFLERRRDFGAELPALVLLNIMDRAPNRKCVSAGI